MGTVHEFPALTAPGVLMKHLTLIRALRAQGPLEDPFQQNLSDTAYLMSTVLGHVTGQLLASWDDNEHTAAELAAELATTITDQIMQIHREIEAAGR